MPFSTLFQRKPHLEAPGGCLLRYHSMRSRQPPSARNALLRRLPQSEEDPVTDQSTINVRISTTLKKRGDDVLSKAGGSPSQAIRALWAEMARTRAVPDFILRDLREGAQDERMHKHSALRGLDNLAGASASRSDVRRDDLPSAALQAESEVTS